jgi:hypothetical protein
VHLDDNDKPFVVDVRPSFEMGKDSAFRYACEQTERGYDKTILDIVTTACLRVNAFEDTELQLPRPAPPQPPVPADKEPSAPGPTETAGAEAMTPSAGDAPAPTDDAEPTARATSTAT